MLNIIGSIIGLIGSGVSGFFGLKQAQSENVSRAIEAVNQSNISAEGKERAIAMVISSEANSGYWLAAAWRPLTMVIFVSIVVAYALGFTTPNLLTQMPENSVMAQIFELVKIGLMGYIPARSLEKIVEKVSWTQIINKILSSK